MSGELLRQRRLRLVQTAALIGVQVVLAVRAAALVLGPAGAFVALGVVAVVTIHSVTHQQAMFPAGSRVLHAYEAPELFSMLNELVGRAGIGQAPRLILVPHRSPVALTTGWGAGAVVVVSDGLLASLSARELRAVLAHEIAHLRNHDLPLFALVGAMQRLTHLVSVLLTLIVLLGLPLLLMGLVILPPRALLYLALVPMLSLLTQQALVRTREFQADLGAAELTGDPEALVWALYRLDRNRSPWWMVMSGGTARRGGLSELLSTHPSTRERIEQLRAL